MMYFECSWCKDTGKVDYFWGLAKGKCPSCEERKKKKEKILAEKLAAVHPPVKWETVEPRLKLDKQVWFCMSNVLKEGTTIGVLLGEADTPRLAYLRWNKKRLRLRIQIK